MASCLLQVIMELVLFSYFITVLCRFSFFLKTIRQKQITKKEFQLVQTCKQILTSFALIVGLIMVTDSLYALVAPYLWIYNAIVIDKPKQLYSFFDVALQLFMLMNTIFSVFLLYTLAFF